MCDKQTLEKKEQPETYFPDEIWSVIISYLGLDDQENLALCCRQTDRLVIHRHCLSERIVDLRQVIRYPLPPGIMKLNLRLPIISGDDDVILIKNQLTELLKVYHEPLYTCNLNLAHSGIPLYHDISGVVRMLGQQFRVRIITIGRCREVVFAEGHDAHYTER